MIIRYTLVYILLTSFHYRVLLFPVKRKVRFFDESDIWFSPPVAKSVLLICFCCLGYYTIVDRLIINEWFHNWSCQWFFIDWFCGNGNRMFGVFHFSDLPTMLKDECTHGMLLIIQYFTFWRLCFSKLGLFWFCNPILRQ